MKRVGLGFLGSLVLMMTAASPAAACFCGGPSLDEAFNRAAEVFVGQVVGIDGPRSIEMESGVKQYYVVKFFVWDRWKGSKAIQVQVLSHREESCFDDPPMKVDQIYLVFADPLTSKNSSSNIEGIVTTCGRTSRMAGPGPETHRNNGLADMFSLDRLVKQEQSFQNNLFGPYYRLWY